MSRGRNGHSSHHRKKYVVIDFLARVFYGIGSFFHWLFRPVRHLFRALGKASRRVEDKLLEVYDDIDISLSRRKNIRTAKRLKKKENDRRDWKSTKEDG